MFLIKEVNNFDELLTLKEEWNNIVEKSQGSTIFQTFEWLYNYSKHFSTKNSLLILLAFYEDKLIGIAPLQKLKYNRFGIFRQKKITFIGEVFSEYNDFIIYSEYFFSAINSFLQYLSENYSDYYLDLRDIPIESITNTFFIKQTRYFKIELKSEVYLFVNTSGNIKDYLSKYSKKTIQTLKSKIKKLQELNSEFTFCNYIDENDFLKLIEYNLYRQNKKHLISFFQNENNISFIQQIVKEYNNSSFLLYSLCQIDNQTKSIYLCFLFNNKVYFYLSGFDLEFKKYSLGMVHLHKILEYCFNNNIYEFDFMRGSDDYKFRFHPEKRYLKRYLININNNFFVTILFIFIKLKKIFNETFFNKNIIVF